MNNDTHIINIARQERGLALVQVLDRFSKDPAKREYYVVNHNAESDTVRTAIAADRRGACEGIAPLTPEGIASVAAPRTRHAAMRWFRRLSCDRSPLVAGVQF